MRNLLLFTLSIVLAACASAPVDFEVTLTPQGEIVSTSLPPKVPPTPDRKDEVATPPASTVIPASTVPEPGLDLSAVSLFETTHLMDPRYFQVSLDGWPDDLAAELIVRIGEEAYICEILFPDDFPNRAYCWGKTPGKPGEQMAIKLYHSEIEAPLVEIELVIPSPGAGGGS